MRKLWYWSVYFSTHRYFQRWWVLQTTKMKTCSAGELTLIKSDRWTYEFSKHNESVGKSIKYWNWVNVKRNIFSFSFHRRRLYLSHLLSFELNRSRLCAKNLGLLVMWNLVCIIFRHTCNTNSPWSRTKFIRHGVKIK